MGLWKIRKKDCIIEQDGTILETSTSTSAAKGVSWKLLAWARVPISWQRKWPAIENAQVIFGSKRALELAKEHINASIILTDYTLKTLPENAVVLSTGDPMLSGLGKYAKTGMKLFRNLVIAGCMREASPWYRGYFGHNGSFKGYWGCEKNGYYQSLIVEECISPSGFVFGALEVAEFLKDHGLLEKSQYVNNLVIWWEDCDGNIRRAAIRWNRYVLYSDNFKCIIVKNQKNEHEKNNELIRTETNSGNVSL